MASFDQAIPVVLRHEGDGGGRAVKGDPGGATRWGITWRTLDRARVALAGLPASVADLSVAQAIRIYRALWWDPQPYAQVEDDQVATKILDMDVNMGPDAIRHLQFALNAVLGDHLPGTMLFGPRTLEDVNRSDPTQLLLELGRQQAEHYRSWIEKDPHPPERERMRDGLMARAAWPYPGRAALVA